jgi:hypothetical protein
MQAIQAMPALADLIIHDIVKNYSAYSMPIWQPERIKHAMSLISEDIAGKLDYSNANECAKSVAKLLDVDITPLLVKHKYPVWVDVKNENMLLYVSRNSNKLVISFSEDISESTSNIEKYAERINADLVILTGRTQGYKQLEKHRVKAFVEKYDRTIYIDEKLFIKDSYPSLFDLVPENTIGICDDVETDHIGYRNDSRIFLLKAEAFKRFNVMEASIYEALKYELDLMNTKYDDGVVVCCKQHADIWSPFTFPYRFKKDENKGWMEILIYRMGYDVFKLPHNLNHTILDDTAGKTIYGFRYEGFNADGNIVNTWLYDNNKIGYKDKEPIDMRQFRILSLYHNEEQKNSIENKGYIEYVNLNNLGSKFDNSFTESRIYYENFDYLFPPEYKYAGLTTGSWNLKYVGLNPIDQLDKWPAIRQLDQNVVLCSDTEPTRKFFSERSTVLHNVFKEITLDLIKEFLQMINLETEYEDIQVPVSNQIIAKRDIVKSLFEFYQSNEILDKIQFFMNKHSLTVKDTAYGGEAYIRRSGFFAETATSLWMNQNRFTIMPQEVLKTDWYK